MGRLIVERYHTLSPQQVEIVKLYAEGNTLNGIAVHLGQTYSSTREQMRRIREKLGARSNDHAAVLFNRLVKEHS